VRVPTLLRDQRTNGWLTTVVVCGLAAAVRLPALDRPHELVFDETYYVKDAWTLLQLGYEAQWPDDPNPAFEAGDVMSFTTEPSYVVHPQVGKWLIALGLRVFGAQDLIGWRISAAVAGILCVVLLTRIARRLLRSTVAGGVAGGLLAIDGTGIVLSRTALLDGFLALFVLAAFGALLLDRDHTRRRLATLTAPPRAPTRWGPGLGLRPWRIVAGVLLGLAVGTKWSGVWFIVVFGLLTVGWDVAARRGAGVRRWWQGTLVRDAFPAVVSIVPVALLTYVASWFSWLRTSGGYGRHWATEHPGEGVMWLPPALRSLLHYHQQMLTFHTGLSNDHPYESSAGGWLILWRPTAFFYESDQPAQQYCGSDRCSQAVTSGGNPVTWWLATLAVVACLWWVVRRRDGLAVAALSGIAAGWLPWFAFPQRTTFAFYAVAFVPWLILCLTLAGIRLLRWGEAVEGRRAAVRVVVVAALAAIVWTSWYFLPLWTGEVITFRQWQLRQWMRSWT
jgi:dolichyl-phosphate-mannose-protein mannosyltransferase